MAWIYLAESVESQSHLNLGLIQSLTANKTDMLNQSSFQECQRERFIEHQSGMILQPLEEKCSLKFTLSSEDSHAKTSVLQDLVRAWQESEAVYSMKLSGSQKKFDRLLSSLKMSQPLELEDWNRLSKHLPKSGMTVAGRVYLPQALEPLTKEKDGSYWLTPRAMEVEESYQSYIERMKRSGNPKCSTKKKAMNLAMQVRYPHLWPTPRASECKDCGPVGSKSHVHMKSKQYLCAQVKEESKPRGMLNPQWVEWLMGYNIGHTELNALGIAWFQFKQEQHL